MRSKRVQKVLTHSRIQAAARFSQIERQQTLVEKKIDQAHELLAEGDMAPQLRLLMSVHARNSLGRSRQLRAMAKKSEAAILKAAQLEAGAKRRHQSHVASAAKTESKKQLSEIIDACVGKPPTSQY